MDAMRAWKRGGCKVCEDAEGCVTAGLEVPLGLDAHWFSGYPRPGAEQTIARLQAGRGGDGWVSRERASGCRYRVRIPSHARARRRRRRDSTYLLGPFGLRCVVLRREGWDRTGRGIPNAKVYNMAMVS